MKNTKSGGGILVVSVNKEPLHYYEFVKPIEDVLKNEEIKFFTKHYAEVGKKDLEKASKIIICGTSLQDFDYLEEHNL